MSSQGQLTRQEFEKQLVLKAWKDPKFKEKLLKDPKATVQAELQGLDKSFQLPKDMVVRVLEEDSKTLYVVLPIHPQEALKKVELSDKQVEDAAGGSITVVAIAGVAVAATAQLAANFNTAANANAIANGNVSYNANATTNVNTMS